MEALKSLWLQSKLNEKTLFDDKNIVRSIKAKSGNTLTKLKHKIYLRLWFCAAISITTIGFTPFASHVSIQILLSILAITYLIGSIFLYQEYAMLNDDLDLAQDLLSTLEQFKSKIKEIIRFEEIISLLLFPVSATSGFLLGMSIYNPHTSFLNDPWDWFLLLIPMAVLLPLSHFMNRWLNQRSFGHHLETLQRDINELMDNK
ncbi:MAG: hypothetical protein ACJA08_002759 [Cyclobacteriaceae bacterium]|jgi:hypothetical protein